MSVGIRWSLVLALLACIGVYAVWRAWPRSPTLTDAEVATLSDRVRAMATKAAETAKASCHRAPLRGASATPTAGPAAASLVEKDGPLAACHAHIEKTVALEPLLWREPDKQSRFAPRLIPLADAEPEPLAAVRKACRDFPARLATAVSVNQACSPNATSGTFDQHADRSMALVRLAIAALAEARHLRRVGRGLAAGQLLTDYIRYAQDFARGQVTLIEEMVAVTAVRKVHSELVAIATDPDALLELRTTLASELDALVASTGTAGMMAPVEESRMAAEMLARAAEASGEERAGILSVVFINDALAAHRTEVCPTDASFQQCVSAWETVSKDPSAIALPTVSSKPMNQVLRAARKVAITGRSKYVRQKMEMVAALSSLAAAAGSEPGGDCPRSANTEALGVELKLERDGNTARITLPRRDGELELLRFRCPF